MSGLLKICGLPQMRAAWLAAGGLQQLKAYALARLEVMADTYLSVNTPVQLAIPGFLEQREQRQSFQQQLMVRVRKNLGGTRPPVGRTEILEAAGSGSWSGDPPRRRACDRSAQFEECMYPSRAFLRLARLWL